MVDKKLNEASPMTDDDGQYLASNFLKKKDDDTQYLASNFRKKPKEEKKSLLQRVGEDVDQHINKPIEAFGRSARDMAAGFGQGLANIIPGAANLGISGINAVGGNIPKVPMIDLAPHNASSTAGEVASFFSLPKAAMALGRIPRLGRAAHNVMKIPMVNPCYKTGK